MSKLAQLFILVTFCVMNIIQLQAQTSPRISIQGTLKDANGASVSDGTYTVDFKLYDVTTGGVALWVETASVEVTGGIYSHYLGSVTALNPGIFGQTLYLGVKVGTFELVPRTEMTYAPYTFASNTVVCSGAIGDVKYSILNPTQFATVNGDCWVPMTGGSMNGSALGAILGSANIPDAGGLFIRAQETAGGGDHDPDRTPTSPIATFEDQTTQSHTHSLSGSTSNGGAHTHNINLRLSNGTAAGNISGLGGFYPIGNNSTNTGDPMIAASDRMGEGTVHTFSIGGVGDHSHTLSGNTGGNNGFSGSETRPKNMNLYIYIRIN